MKTQKHTTKAEWQIYVQEEISRIQPILKSCGFALSEDQPHILGERFLMQAATTVAGRKLILIGRRTNDNLPVVIKVSSDAAGKKEMKHERLCRVSLEHISFAYQKFLSPKELHFNSHDKYMIFIQEYIDTKCSFLDRSLKEQFTFTLSAFKAQESAHASTYEHRRYIKKVFQERRSREYMMTYSRFEKNIRRHFSDQPSIEHLLEQVHTFLRDHQEIIEQYSGFLTHTDFVPHNIRIKDSSIYLLDHSSICFGNKYDGWARFINFMTLHNPPLANALVTYVKDNRSYEESLDLKIMRVYRLCEIVYYYINTLPKVDGDLHALNSARISWWMAVLRYVLNDTPIPEDERTAYIHLRNTLRSEEEKRRQIGLH